MIEAYDFGRIVINSKIFTNDLKIIHNKPIPDWRRKSGHRVTVDDVRDVLKVRPEIFILGQGKPGMMKAEESLRETLKKTGITLIEINTTEAVRIFNQLLTEKKDIAAGFHLTC